VSAPHLVQTFGKDIEINLRSLRSVTLLITFATCQSPAQYTESEGELLGEFKLRSAGVGETRHDSNSNIISGLRFPTRYRILGETDYESAALTS